MPTKGSSSSRLRAALYARLSASDDPANLDQQIARGRRYAEERGWDVVGEFVEAGRSAFNDAHRTEWPRIEGLIEAGEVDVVVARHIDRTFRKTWKALAVRDRTGVHFALYDQGVDTTRGDRLSFAIGSVLAEEESRVKSDRQRAFRERERARGRLRIGGPRAYGFEPDGVTPRRSEQVVIRRSAERIARGDSLRSVRRYWAERGVLNSKGQPVRQNVIRQVLLRAERYGVPEETARRVRAILEDPRRQHNREGANRRRFPLSGLVVCECGGKLYGRYMTRSRVPYYRCSTAVDGCGVTSIQADKLEDHVWREVAIRESLQGDAQVEDDGTDERVQELQEAIANEQARAANKRRDYADDLIEARTLREALDRVEERVATLRQEIADLARSQPRLQFSRLIEPLTFDEERSYLTSMIERVEVRRTNRNPRVPAAERTTILWRES